MIRYAGADFSSARKRMRPLTLRLAALLFLSTTLAADTLPGFRVETVAPVPGFISSVVVDSRGVIYATTTDGWIHRVEGTQSVPVVALPTRAGGNGGLLGMALLDDNTAVVHYTTWQGERVLDDVIATVDLATGAGQVLKEFVGDIESRERGVSDEHHGGNVTVGSDGSIFVGIGEYGERLPAQLPEWNGGKIWKLDRLGNATQFARGLRNPYDLAWDPGLGRVVLLDNGAVGGDELHVVQEGDNCGWPVVSGGEQSPPGFTAPVYVFPDTVAPTGLLRLGGTNPILPRGYLAGAFVTRSIYHFADVGASPVAEPVAVLSAFAQFVIDVTEGPGGEIYFAAATSKGSTIHRLVTPGRGDCNGDGLTNSRDILPILRELEDGPTRSTYRAQEGAHVGSWGCDANADGLITRSDVDALLELIGSRRRVTRS